MTVQWSRIETVLRAIVHELKVERVTFMAGSIAYNAFLSLLPLLLLLVAIVGTVSNRTVEEGLLEVTRAALTPRAADVIVAELQSSSAGVSIVGLVALLWGALRIFRSLDMAFSDIYESQAENTLTNQLHDGIIVLVSVAGVIGVGIAIESLVPAGVGSAGAVGWLAQRLLLVVVIGLALLPMYYLFPDEKDMALVEAIPGVAVAAVGLVAAESLFRLYIQYNSAAAENSLLAGIIVLMTWLYVSGLVILVGAAVNAVLSNRSEDVSIRPVVGSVPIEEDDQPTPPSDERARAGDGVADSVQAIDDLRERLPTATNVEIVVDGDPIAVPPPDRVGSDRETSAIPFVNDTVSIDFHWNERAQVGDTDQDDGHEATPDRGSRTE